MEKTYEMLWPGWETVDILGDGSYGVVYKISRQLPGQSEPEYAALKRITIPQKDSEITDMYDFGYDKQSISNTFRNHMESILSEYTLMRKMNGTANVVNCDEVKYIPHEDGVGWDILIKMELLTPLQKSLPERITEEMVIRVGKDICRALVLCRKHNIVHRDIKPQNIFLSENGDYKLGDFGVSKTMEKAGTASVRTGTYRFMAPEVYHGQHYGSAVDIYSLGIVLYWLLNKLRTPFLPLPPMLLDKNAEERAMNRRFDGEAIPAPVNGSEELKAIVLKACAFDPKDRYQSAAEMLEALNGLGKGEKEPIHIPQDIGTEPEDEGTQGINWKPEAVFPDDEDGTVGKAKKIEKPPVKPAKRKKPWLIAAVVAVAVLFGAVTMGGGTPSVKHQMQAYDSKICCGEWNTFSIQENGTVNAIGAKVYGLCDVEDWTDIVSVSAWNIHAVGLKSNGTVVATGDNTYGQCDVDNWKSISAVSAGPDHTIGLQSNGFVVAVGRNDYGECDVGDWTDIIAISTGDCITLGLKSDGTVEVAGRNDNGECDVISEWTDIIAVSVGYGFAAGLKSDGTVIVTAQAGSRYHEIIAVSEWTDIVAVCSGSFHIIGLRSDGTVVATGDSAYGKCDVDEWGDIVAVNTGVGHTVGIRSDGTIVAVGRNEFGQCNVELLQQ